ncbi:MAG: LapA family protein [bacterium]
MKFFKSLIFWVVAVILFFVALLLAADNSEEVALTFLEYSTPQWPISWWVLASFVAGVVFTSLLNIWSNSALRLVARKANSQVKKTNQTLDKVRAEKEIKRPTGSETGLELETGTEI